MRTDRRSRRGAADPAGHRRTLVAGTCLVLAAGGWTAWTFQPHAEAAGSVLVVANPVYAAASPASVAPRALTADRTLTLPAGVSVAVEPEPSGVLRVTATAPDAVTARDVANRVLDTGLPAALRAQVADGLRLRRAASAAPAKVAAADVDATLAAYRLRIVTVSRATGTTPSGADAVQAVAVAQVGGLPATTPDPQVVTRVLASALDAGAVDGVVAGRRASATVTSPGGPALAVVAAAGSKDLAGRVAQDVLDSVRTPLTRLLRSSGLPDETLVVQPYLVPAAAAVRPVPPWWLTGLVGLVALALVLSVLLDRRDRALRADRAERPDRAEHPERRTPRTAPLAARGRRPAPAVPHAPGPSMPAVPVPAGAPLGALAGSQVVAPVPAPVGMPSRPWDWSPVRLADYGDLPVEPVAPAGPDWGAPRAMPPAGLPPAAAAGVPAHVRAPQPAADVSDGSFAEPFAGSSAGSSADPAGEPLAGPAPAAVAGNPFDADVSDGVVFDGDVFAGGPSEDGEGPGAGTPDGPDAAQEVAGPAVTPVSVVDLRSRIFGDGPDDGDGGVPASPAGPRPDDGTGRAVADPPRSRLGDRADRSGRADLTDRSDRTGAGSSGPAGVPGGPAVRPAAPQVPSARHGARHGHDLLAGEVPAPPVVPSRLGARPFEVSSGAPTGLQPGTPPAMPAPMPAPMSPPMPPVVPPAMPGPVPAAGDPTSFAPPQRSVLVDPQLPQVVRREPPRPAAGIAHPLAATGDPDGPFGAPAQPLPQPGPGRAAPSVPAQQTAGHPARTVTPFVPPTVRSTRRPGTGPAADGPGTPPQPVPNTWQPPVVGASAPSAGTTPGATAGATPGLTPGVLPGRTPGRPAGPAAAPAAAPAGRVPVPLPVPLPSAEDLGVDGPDDEGAGGDRAWSDILGSGAAPRRGGRPTRFRGGRR